MLLVLANNSTGGVRPPAVKQTALPPFDLSGNPQTFLPPNQISLPNKWDKRFWRGNLWCVTIPGLPFVPGGSSLQPERCLTWFLDRWTKDWQIKILQEHAKRGYTHFSLSLPDSLSYGTSLQGFIALCQLVKSYGFYVHVFLGSKDFNPHDEWWDGWWKDTLAPMLQQLLDAHCIDIVTPGWEWNIWNIPGDATFEIYQNIANMCRSYNVDVWTHFSVGYTSWFANGGNRFQWWNSMQGILTGILYQGDVNWDMGTRQARAADTQNQDSFANGTFKFVYFEADAAAQFDGAQPDELTSAMHGYLMLCSPGGCAISGGGNGFWLPDGTPTLVN